MMIALLACSFSLPRDKSGRGVSSSSSHRRHSWRIVHHPRFGQQSTYVHCHVIPYRFELSLRLVCADRPTNQPAPPNRNPFEIHGWRFLN